MERGILTCSQPSQPKFLARSQAASQRADGMIELFQEHPIPGPGRNPGPVSQSPQQPGHRRGY